MSIPALHAFAEGYHYPYLRISSASAIPYGINGWLCFLLCASDTELAQVSARIEQWNRRLALEATAHVESEQAS